MPYDEMLRSKLYSSSLRRSHAEIRLLSLQPGAWDCPIRCKLRTASLDDKPSYCALSYVWGNLKATADIEIDGEVVPVTENLEDALRHVRDERDDRILWVDAVCINQENTEERNEQVAMMGDVYAMASTVLIWIGKADDLSVVAFDSMKSVAQGNVDDVARTQVCSFYMNLNQRPWFSRVWVIQELAVAAQDPVVQCGFKSASWSVFVSAWTVLSTELFKEIGMVRRQWNDADDGTQGGVEVLARIKLDLLNDIRNFVRDKKVKTLDWLFRYSRTSEASEPRDRIYALLGMLSEKERADIKVDYDKPVSAVFTEAMIRIFESGSGPFFLSSMWLHGGKSAIAELPTWVIDFSAQTAEKTGQPSNISFHPPCMESVSGAGAGAKNGEVEQNRSMLRVETLFVDTVKETLDFHHTFNGCIRQLEMVETLAARARSVVIPDGPLKSYYEKYRSVEPIWKLLVSGRKHLSAYDAAPEYYGQEYAKLLTQADRLKGDITHSSEQEDNLAEEYRRCMETSLPRRTFFTTTNGLTAIGSPGIRPKDQVTVWLGAPTPFVTRPCIKDSDQGMCELIGAAYVGGIMDGDIVDELYLEELLDTKTLHVV